MREKENTYTIQSNDITTSRSLLNIYERRILNAIIQNVSDVIKQAAKYKVQAIDYYPDAGDETALIMEFRANEIVKHDRYEELRLALETLRSRAVYIEKKTGTRITGFLNWAELPKYSDKIKISIDKVFYQTLFNLSNGYTIFQATVMNSLTSIHATKLYEVLAGFRDKEAIVLTIEELRRLTNCQDVYPQYGSFKKYVLEVAKNQLDNNKITDIRFTYKDIKLRQKVVKVQFFIIKTENAHEISLERNKISPHWDFTKDLVTNAQRMGINLKGKNLELFKEYKSMFGEDVLATDLVTFQQIAKDKGKGVAYVIGCLKNKIQDNSQIKISYEDTRGPKKISDLLEGMQFKK